MLKDYKRVIDLKNTDKLAELAASKNEPEFGLLEYFEGNLLDNYVFINYDYKKGSGIYLKPWHKPRKYIIVYERCVNCWTSENVAIETNNEKEYKKFLRLEYEAQKEREKAELEYEAQN